MIRCILTILFSTAGRAVATAGVVPALCGLVARGKPPTQEVAARALWLLAAGRPDVAREAVKRGAVSPLTSMLGLPWDNMRASAAKALAALAVDVSGQVRLPTQYRKPTQCRTAIIQKSKNAIFFKT
jgi:hypothetical protein